MIKKVLVIVGFSLLVIFLLLQIVINEQRSLFSSPKAKQCTETGKLGSEACCDKNAVKKVNWCYNNVKHKLEICGTICEGNDKVCNGEPSFADCNGNTLYYCKNGFYKSKHCNGGCYTGLTGSKERVDYINGHTCLTRGITCYDVSGILPCSGNSAIPCCSGFTCKSNGCVKNTPTSEPKKKPTTRPKSSGCSPVCNDNTQNCINHICVAKPM